MYKILVVDDEMLVRMGIKSCINWKGNGFFEPLEASNGLEAFEIMHSEKIDVVLTDIKMPKMDGLELVRKIREASIQTEIIILSCHNDFEYVKKALEIGACDYLFKHEMLPKDIIGAIKKSVEKIREKYNTNNRIKMLETRMLETASKIKETYILDIIEGKKVRPDEFHGKKEELGIRFDRYNLSVIVLKSENADEILIKKYENDAYLLKFSIMNIISEVITPLLYTEAVLKSIDEYVVIFSDQNEHSLKKNHDFSREITLRIIDALKKHLGLSVNAGVSNCFHKLESMKTAYNEARYSTDKRFFSEKSDIVYYENSISLKNIDSSEIKGLLAKLEKSEEAGEDYTGKIKLIFNAIRDNQCLQFKDVIEVSANIAGVLLKKAMQYEGVLEELYGNEPEIYLKIFSSRSITEIEAFITAISMEIDRIIARRFRNEINEAVKYIEKYLGDFDISLEKVARHVNISRTYFSRVFKEATGKSFIDYLTSARIEKAEKLYHTTNLKVYQIAELVGYPNWRYFCKVYKKQTGKHISQLKNKK